MNTTNRCILLVLILLLSTGSLFAEVGLSYPGQNKQFSVSSRPFYEIDTGLGSASITNHEKFKLRQSGHNQSVDENGDATPSFTTKPSFTVKPLYSESSSTDSDLPNYFTSLIVVGGLSAALSSWATSWFADSDEPEGSWDTTFERSFQYGLFVSVPTFIAFGYMMSNCNGYGCMGAAGVLLLAVPFYLIAAGVGADIGYKEWERTYKDGQVSKTVVFNLARTTY